MTALVIAVVGRAAPSETVVPTAAFFSSSFMPGIRSETLLVVARHRDAVIDDDRILRGLRHRHRVAAGAAGIGEAAEPAAGAVVVMLNALAAPVALLTTSRAPALSCTMLAARPAPASLIALASPSSVLLPLSMTTAKLPLAVVRFSVPLPTAVALVAEIARNQRLRLRQLLDLERRRNVAEPRAGDRARAETISASDELGWVNSVPPAIRRVERGGEGVDPAHRVGQRGDLGGVGRLALGDHRFLGIAHRGRQLRHERARVDPRSDAQ